MSTTPKRQNNPQPADIQRKPSRSATVEFLRRLIPPPSTNSWYKRRQRIAWQIESISKGKLMLLDNACRADGRLKVQHLDCKCVFYASLRDIRHIGTQHICPFCNIQTLDDVTRFGSVQAVREFVDITTLGCLDFSPDNILSSSSADYEWRCLLHNGARFAGSFAAFAKAPNEFCPICRRENRS